MGPCLSLSSNPTFPPKSMSVTFSIPYISMCFKIPRCNVKTSAREEKVMKQKSIVGQNRNLMKCKGGDSNLHYPTDMDTYDFCKPIYELNTKMLLSFTTTPTISYLYNFFLIQIFFSTCSILLINYIHTRVVQAINF